MNSSDVKNVSEWFIKPKYEVKESNHPFYYLSPWGLSLLNVHYIQSGLFFSKPRLYPIDILLESLKLSLSSTLVHFYPLAGRFSTRVQEDEHECSVFVDCNKGLGVKFIHATLHNTLSDILSPTHVPLVVRSFFDLNGVSNYEGHTHPLLSVQVTELLDGIFIGVSMNHSLVDGISFWHFWNVWSDIHKSPNGNLSPLCEVQIDNCVGSTFSSSVFNPNGYGEPNNKYKTPQLRSRIFHFSSKSIRMLKEKANKESNTHHKISSLQALTAHVWRAIVRASTHFDANKVTTCGLAINNRPRSDPPLPENYFSCVIDFIKTPTTVGELLGQSLGWAALQVNQSVENHTNMYVRESLERWLQSPVLDKLESIFDSFSMVVTMSPRFDIYRNEFGLGKPLAARNGGNNIGAGNLVVYPGHEGGGSMDMEIYLPFDSMKAIESDKEFMDVVSP